MSDLILAGDHIPCEAPVQTWFDHGLEFIPDVHRRIRRRFTKPDSIVWHWTAAENPPESVYRILRRRGLGVEFAIGCDGTIYQFCDPAIVDARDCGSWWDRRSVGVEIVNYGMRRPSLKPWSWHVPKKGRDRKIVKTHLRGRDVHVAEFYADQVASADALADALRMVFHIPHVMPRDNNGPLLDRPMNDTEELAWDGGEVGHLQITTRSKPDPGMPFLEHRAHVIGRA